jgi:hypothetical protein
MKNSYIDKYFLLLLFMVSSMCGTQESGREDATVSKSIYNVKICYLGCFNDRINPRPNSLFIPSSDSLYVFLETGFRGDLLTVYVNNNFEMHDTITTDPRVGFSNVYTFGNRNKIKEIAFELNNGPKARMEIGESIRLVNVNYEDSTLIVSVLKTSPAYD